jgi:transcriptional regulator with GAF, ATPase, and Fis domain
MGPTPNELRRLVDTRLVGTSETMRALKELMVAVGPTDTRVLITGETGCGKDVVATLLHGLRHAEDRAHMLRKDDHLMKAYFTANCAGFPDTLAHSELFGHVEGAFTGATFSRVGCYGNAGSLTKSTLFLDEVAELSRYVQALLLRALEGNWVRLVGDDREKRLPHVPRVICATSGNVRTLVAEGRFREDLYFRISAIELCVPPLRARAGDIEALILHRDDGTEVLAWLRHQRLLKALTGYRFPGNVRELYSLLDAVAALRRHSDKLAVEQLEQRIAQVGGDERLRDVLAGKNAADFVNKARRIAKHLKPLFETKLGKRSVEARALPEAKAVLAEIRRELEIPEGQPLSAICQDIPANAKRTAHFVLLLVKRALGGGVVFRDERERLYDECVWQPLGEITLRGLRKAGEERVAVAAGRRDHSVGPVYTTLQHLADVVWDTEVGGITFPDTPAGHGGPHEDE